MKKLAPSVLAVSAVFSLIGPMNAASAHEFQEHAAINDDKNEVADTAGMTRSTGLNASKSDGVAIGVLKGQKYRLEVAGVFVYAAGATADGRTRIADAECAIDPVGDRNTGSQWQSERFKGWGSDLLDVLVSNTDSVGEVQFKPVDPFPPLSLEGEMGCSRTNTYYADITPIDWWLRFRVDDRYFTDNVGSLEVNLTRGAFTAARLYEGKTYQCPKWTEESMQPEPGTVGSILHADVMLDSRRNPKQIPNPAATDLTGNKTYPLSAETGHWGMYTCNWALPDTTYRITVDGVWKYNRDEGELALADAECATGSMEYEEKVAHLRTDTRGPEAWMDRRYISTIAGSDQVIDNLDLMINKDTFKDRKWIPMYPDPENPACAGDSNHTYYFDFRPDRTGPIHLQMGDWDYYEEDNRGMLCIHIERLGAESHSHASPENTQEHEVLTTADFLSGLGG